MRWVHVACWALLAPGLVGWAMQTGQARGDEPKAAFDKLVLGSSGGIAGTGSGKGLTVEAKGQIVTKARAKQKKGELKADELDQLKKLVAAVDWKKVKPSYQGKGADFFMDDLAVTVGGKKFETHISEEVKRKDLPKDLGALLDYLDKLYDGYKP
jgi:hypothetical protein